MLSLHIYFKRYLLVNSNNMTSLYVFLFILLILILVLYSELAKFGMVGYTYSQMTGMENRLSRNRWPETGYVTRYIPHRVIQGISSEQLDAKVKLKFRQGCYYF